MASKSAFEVRLSAAALGDVEVDVRGLVAREALSRPFELDVELAVVHGELELAELVGNPIALTLVREGEEQRRIAGVVVSADDLLSTDATGALAGYALRVAPRLHLLSLNERLQVFLDKSIPEIVTRVLEVAGLEHDRDFVLALEHHYPQREFVVQYRESDLDFLNRLTEQVGITYYFLEVDGRDVVHFVDETVGEDVHKPLRHDPRREGFGVFSVRRSVRAIPSRVRVDDYDYSRPLLGLVANSPVAGGIGGEVYEYGPNYTTPEEGHHLASVRAAELAARRDVYSCASTEPSVFAGARVAVEGTPRGELSLLVVEVETHFEVREPEDDEQDETRVLTNTFRAIPRERAFRPERRTPRPRVQGMLTGVIDAAVRDEYASIDEHGRYRVKLLFDASGPAEGHASLPIRMAQSHAGPGYGMHFPLRPGIEVLIAFVDGDPDRPVIAGCVPNALTPSPVTRANSKRNVIRTGSNNEINIDDQQGAERIKLSTPRHDTVLQMGAANAPEEGIHLATGANFSSITKTGSAFVSGGNALLSGKHAFIGGDVVSLAGKTVAERVKAIMEMGEAVTEVLASVAGMIGETGSQPTKAVLSAQVEKTQAEVDEDEKELAEAEQETPRDEAKIAKKREDLKEKKEKLEKLEMVEERVEQATEAANAAVEAIAGGITDVTKLVSLVCDAYSEIERIRAMTEISGKIWASIGNTIVSGARGDLDMSDEIGHPFNLVASDKVAALSGEKIGFVYGEHATVFGEYATVTAETTTVAGRQVVEVSSQDKVWLHATPATVQLMPETGVTLQASPGNVVLLTPEGELNVTTELEVSIETAAVNVEAEAEVEIAAGSFAVEAAAASIAVEDATLTLMPAGGELAFAAETFVKTDASGVTLQPVAGSLLNFAPAGALTVTAASTVTVTAAGYTLVNSAVTTIGGTEILIG